MNGRALRRAVLLSCGVSLDLNLSGIVVILLISLADLRWQGSLEVPCRQRVRRVAEDRFALRQRVQGRMTDRCSGGFLLRIENASRIGLYDLLSDEKAVRAIALLNAVAAYYHDDRQWLLVEAKDFAKACKTLGLTHMRTKRCTPKTNCKTEQFIQIALREGAL